MSGISTRDFYTGSKMARVGRKCLDDSNRYGSNRQKWVKNPGKGKERENKMALEQLHER
jgi:hypothetical protein